MPQHVQALYIHHSGAWLWRESGRGKNKRKKLVLPTVEDIVRLHTAPKPEGHGWRQVGYQAIVDREGKGHYYRAATVTPAAQKGHNTNSIAICIAGWNGPTSPDPTWGWNEAQIQALREYVNAVRIVWPEIKIFNHYDVAATICPGLDARELLT